DLFEFRSQRVEQRACIGGPERPSAEPDAEVFGPHGAVRRHVPQRDLAERLDLVRVTPVRDPLVRPGERDLRPLWRSLAEIRSAEERETREQALLHLRTHSSNHLCSQLSAEEAAAVERSQGRTTD